MKDPKAFEDAVLTGDLETIEAFFAQQHVQRHVDETNNRILQTRPTNPRAFTLDEGVLPWFRRPKKTPSDEDDILLLCAARRGHAHVVEWFFSSEQAMFMSATLAFLLPLVAEYDGPRQWNETHRQSDPLVMETLLTSYVFCEVVPTHDQQALLDGVAGLCQTPPIIQLAIAHGARINNSLRSIARCSQIDCVSMLEDEGAMLVGAEVVDVPSEYWAYRHVDAFIERGIDLRGPEQLLIDVAERADDTMITRLLSVGYLDVDARDDSGQTTMMHLASVNPTFDLHPQFEDPTPDITDALLEYVDVDLVDNRGRTALHYAAKNNNIVAAILTSHGADTSVEDCNGYTPWE